MIRIIIYMIQYILLFFMASQPPACASDTLGRMLNFITGSSNASSDTGSSGSVGMDEFGTDRMTENCLHCHDGSITSKVSTHPVGIYYDDYVRRYPGDYRSLGYRGEGGIPLVNGKVSCISCHRLKRALAQVAANGPVTLTERDICLSSTQLNSVSGRQGLCAACHIK